MTEQGIEGRDPDVHTKNMIEVFVMQALLGVLTPNLKALSLDYFTDDPTVITAYFLLREDRAEDREEFLEEFSAEVDAFMGVPEVMGLRVKPVIEIASDRPVGYLPPGRRVLQFRD